MEVDKNFIYSYKIENISFGPLSNENLGHVFSDGRIFGLISEYLPYYFFKDVKKMNNNCFYDNLINNMKVEQRCLTKRGISFIPSCQIGQGRKFNYFDFMEKIKKIQFFLIFDNSKFPIIEFVFIDPSEVDCKKYSYKCARKNFFNKSILIIEKNNINQLYFPFF